MAEKKGGTRAEQAAAGAKKKPAAGKTGGKATPPKKKAPEKVKKGNSDFSGGLAPNVLIAVLSVVLFALFLAIAVNPDGALLRAMKSVILGLLGQGMPPAEAAAAAAYLHGKAGDLCAARDTVYAMAPEDLLAALGGAFSGVLSES